MNLRRFRSNDIRRLFVRALPILLCLLVCAPVAYGDVVVFQDDKDSLSLEIRGRITKSDLSAVIERSKLLGRRSVFSFNLNSRGGDLATALKIGEFIRRSNALVMVPQNSECLSSCVFLLAAGVRRIVDEDAKVGIHRPFSIEDDVSTEAGQKTQYKRIEPQIKDYLKRMNIPTELYDEMFRIPPSSIRILTQGELMHFGLSADDPYFAEALATSLSKREGITKEEYYHREARMNACIPAPGVPEEEVTKCIQKVMKEPLGR